MIRKRSKDMENIILNFAELCVVLEGLEDFRERRLRELKEDGEKNPIECEEYKDIVSLQKKIIKFRNNIAY